MSFPAAALGASIDVPALGGPVDVTIPPGTQSGTTLRLRGLGMPPCAAASVEITT